jgi:hypothetical protein
LIILGVYVDDIIVMSQKVPLIENVKDSLKSAFKMVDFGQAQVILGIHITRDLQNRVLYLDQENYVLETLKQFNMQNATGVTTPMVQGADLCRAQSPKTAEEKAAMANIPYSSLLGRLMYLMVSTRPDLANSIQILSRFMANPGMTHWRALKRVLQYLKRTAKIGIQYHGDLGFTPVGYSDADYAGCKDTRRSTSGYIFLMGGGAISWCSKRQGTMAMSTCEAEYVAAALAAKEAIWEKVFLTELGFEEDAAMVVHCDSQSALHVMQNAVINQRTKAIDITLHFIKELVERRLIHFTFKPTSQQLADIFTKPLGREIFEKFRRYIGLTIPLTLSDRHSSDDPSEEGLLA